MPIVPIIQVSVFLDNRPGSLSKAMDQLDKNIINFLQENGRMRYTKIAEELGVTEGTVCNRAARLQESNTIQIIGMTDPHSMGYEHFRKLKQSTRVI